MTQHLRRTPCVPFVDLGHGVCAILLTMLFVVPASAAMTETQLRAQVDAEYPQFASSNDWERVKILREFSYKHTAWAPSYSSPLLWQPAWSLGAPDRIDHFDHDLGGVFCGDTAITLMRLYEMYGYRAYYLGIYGGPAFSHAETLVWISYGGQDVLTLHDPSENFSFTKTNGTPIDYYELLTDLKSGNRGAISTTGSTSVTAHMLYAPSDYGSQTCAQSAASSWTVDPSNYTCSTINGNVRRIISPRTPQRADAVMGSLYFSWLQTQGLPAETIFLELFPVLQTHSIVAANTNVSPDGDTVQATARRIVNLSTTTSASGFTVDSQDSLQRARLAGTASIASNFLFNTQPAATADGTSSGSGNGVVISGTSNLDFTFGSSYTGNRTLKDITVIVEGYNTGREDYDFDVLYNTTDDATFRTLISGVTNVSVPTGTYSRIRLSQFSGVTAATNVSTIRFVVRKPVGNSETTFGEFDINFFESTVTSTTYEWPTQFPALQTDDSLQTWRFASPNPVVTSTATPQYGSSTDGTSDAISSSNSGNAYIVLGTSNLDFTFDDNYAGGRTLNALTIYVTGLNGGREDYDFDVSYSSVSNPSSFIALASNVKSAGLRFTQKSSKIRLDGFTGTTATNIRTIRIVVRAPAQGYETTYVEFDAQLQ